MAVDYNVKIKGLKPLTKLFRVLVRDMSTERVMSRIGNFVMLRIKDRTSQGLDVDMQAFTAYSTGHQAVRAAKGLPTNIVDLFFHGSMMNAMTYDADDDRVRIYFSPTTGKDARGKPSEVKNPAKAYYLDQERNFFAMSLTDMQTAQKIALDEIDRLLKEK